MNIGTKVRLTQDIDNFPTILAKAGLTGTLIRRDDEYLWVRLDQHFDALDQWHNELQIWNDPDAPAIGALEPIPA